MSPDEIADVLRRHPNVRAFLIGPLEPRGRVDLEPHYHCYIRFRLRQKPYLVRAMFRRLAIASEVQRSYNGENAGTSCVPENDRYNTIEVVACEI